MANTELSDRYDPRAVESRIYQWWEQRGYFKAADQSTRPPFCIILPPPNVTGSLHMGHALNHTIQDIIIRYKRMRGYNALWLPGTDHAGIATQMVVERELKAEGKNRREMGRTAFVERVWEWKRKYGDRIYFQMRKLGDSCDWDRAVFTLDAGVSKAVRKVFVDLYRKGMIYKGQRLINWSTPLETAISDLEVEHKETKGTLYYINYPVDGSDQVLTVATTRPETLLGDVAVAVNPEDDRYRGIVGKMVILPLVKRKIPIIADSYVDMSFGSGVVKITPAHDFNDYNIGVRHKLPMINILNKNGTLNEQAGSYAGLKVQEARKRVINDLKAGELLSKEEPHKHSVGYCSRSGAVVEPFLSEQWFVRMKQLAVPARHVAETQTLRFQPESWMKTYLHWMNIIEDWCISRQLWWGHRIPAWTCEDCRHVTVAETDPTECSECKSQKIRQDEDVLDTWFSSALWPFSTLGWPEKTEALKTFYPTDILVTGFDIIFFWVARMIVSGLEFMKDVPFRIVYINPLIRDAEGKKMSKSVGNALDPVELIDQFGADAVRFTLAAQLSAGRDLKFSQSRLEGYRNFMNKIWNATRFSLAALSDFQADAKSLPKVSELSVADRWIIFETQNTAQVMADFLDQNRFSEAANALYAFIWNELCDWYLEVVKPVIYGEPSPARTAAQAVLAHTLNRAMRLAHPFIPFISEEIYQKLPIRTEALITSEFPTAKSDADWFALGSPEAAFEMQIVKEVITAIRNIRGENSIKPSLALKIRLSPKENRVRTILEQNRLQINRLANLEECSISEGGAVQKCALMPVRLEGATVDVVVPLEGLVDLGEESKRLQKLIDKIQRDVVVVRQKLENENFVKNAPEELVDQEKKLLEQLTARETRLRDSLSRLV